MKRNSKAINHRRKLKELHINFIRDLFSNNKGFRLSVSIIKKRLINKFSELESISDKTIRTALKNDLGYSYKILENIEPKTISEDKIRIFFENAALQLMLDKKQYNIIYLDEFGLSSRKFKVYGWGDKGSNHI